MSQELKALPLRPDEEMVEAGWETHMTAHPDTSARHQVMEIYRAMWAAASTPENDALPTSGEPEDITENSIAQWAYELGDPSDSGDGYVFSQEQFEQFANHIACEHAHHLASLRAEISALRGLTPGLPPRPPEGQELPRYGLRWNGPSQPLAVPMEDGYWTPWHLADQFRTKNTDGQEINP